MRTNNEPAPRITWCPPVGEGFIVSPALAELEAAILHRGAEFWDAGSCDGGLYYDVANQPIAELNLMFAAPDRFCVLHTDCHADIQLVATASPPCAGTVCVRPSGNHWLLPRHYFIDRNTAWQVARSFCRDSHRSPEVRWIPFDPPALHHNAP